jgi:capsule biosynthesis phosphatase
MRICIDLDGVICAHRAEHGGYTDCEPIDEAIESMRKLRSEGHYLIIYTARRMRTHGGNLGGVMADVGALTLEWLRCHDVPYDEIYFGKPYAHVYVDDNALRFSGWHAVMRSLSDGELVYSGPKA